MLLDLLDSLPWNCQGHVVGFVGFASLELAGASCWIRWIRLLELSLESLELSDRIGIPVHSIEPTTVYLIKFALLLDVIFAFFDRSGEFFPRR